MCGGGGVCVWWWWWWGKMRGIKLPSLSIREITFRLMSMTWSKASSLISKNAASLMIPAELTRIQGTLWWSSLTCNKSLLTWIDDTTSVQWYEWWHLSLLDKPFAVSSAPSIFLSATATAAPALANVWQMAFPIPLAPPVKKLKNP